MHALPSYPWSPSTIAIVAVLLAMLALAAAGLDAGALDITIGGSATDAQPITDAPPADPTWLRDPLASPIEILKGG